jgi:hypothetical protein
LNDHVDLCRITKATQELSVWFVPVHNFTVLL